MEMKWFLLPAWRQVRGVTISDTNIGFKKVKRLPTQVRICRPHSTGELSPGWYGMIGGNQEWTGMTAAFAIRWEYRWKLEQSSRSALRHELVSG